MSQSDFLTRKRTKAQLVYQNKLSPILDAQEYTAFKRFSSETAPVFPELMHAKPTTFQKLIEPNKYRIGDIDEVLSDTCPNPFGCSHTQQRSNRRLLTTAMFSLDLHNIYKQTNLSTDYPCRYYATDTNSHPKIEVHTTLTDNRFKRIDECILK